MVLRETLNDYASVDIEYLLDVIEMDRMVLRDALNDYASVAKKTSLMLLIWTEW